MTEPRKKPKRRKTSDALRPASTCREEAFREELERRNRSQREWMRAAGLTEHDLLEAAEKAFRAISEQQAKEAGPEVLRLIRAFVRERERLSSLIEEHRASARDLGGHPLARQHLDIARSVEKRRSYADRIVERGGGSREALAEALDVMRGASRDDARAALVDYLEKARKKLDRTELQAVKRRTQRILEAYAQGFHVDLDLLLRQDSERRSDERKRTGHQRSSGKAYDVAGRIMKAIDELVAQEAERRRKAGEALLRSVAGVFTLAHLGAERTDEHDV